MAKNVTRTNKSKKRVSSTVKSVNRKCNSVRKTLQKVLNDVYYVRSHLEEKVNRKGYHQLHHLMTKQDVAKYKHVLDHHIDNVERIWYCLNIMIFDDGDRVWYMSRSAHVEGINRKDMEDLMEPITCEFETEIEPEDKPHYCGWCWVITPSYQNDLSSSADSFAASLINDPRVTELNWALEKFNGTFK